MQDILERELDPTHVDRHLDHAQQNLERIQEQVVHADNKALIALTFEGALIAGVAVMAPEFRSVLGHEESGFPLAFVVIGGLLLAFGVCAALCILRLFRVITPRIVRDAPCEDPASLIFFGAVAGIDLEEYKSRMKQLSPTQIHEALIQTAHVDARIAANKFADVAVAYRLFSYQVLFFLAALLITMVWR